MSKNLIGTTGGEDWLLYQLKAGAIKRELKEGTRRPEDYKVLLTPQDEYNIRVQERKDKAAANHKKNQWRKFMPLKIKRWQIEPKGL